MSPQTRQPTRAYTLAGGFTPRALAAGVALPRATRPCSHFRAASGPRLDRVECWGQMRRNIGPGGPIRGRSRAVPGRESSGLTGSYVVPLTRSSGTGCRGLDRELRVQRGTRIVELLVVLDSEVRKRGCRKLVRTSESDH